MKKAITILMAVALVFGFAGIASAQEGPTCMDPLPINRGCETSQDACAPFDYENIDEFTGVDWEGNTVTLDNYCTEPEGKNEPRIVFPVCECEFAEDLGEGDVLDIRLEILVNGNRGDNGAYWAQDVNAGGISLITAQSTDDACTNPWGTAAFTGSFVYNNGAPVVACDTTRSTIIEPAMGQAAGTHGYTIESDDALNNLSQWAINVPYMWFDSEVVNEGDVISVEVCLTPEGDEGEVDTGSICGACGCCFEFELGHIECCEAGASYGLVYPYATPMNDANWWYGMVITNLSAKDGVAEITVYETDGDSETITVDVEANSMFVASNVDLMDEFGADIRDSRAYFTVETDFSADGFLFIGNDGKAEAMGYLPRMK